MTVLFLILFLLAAVFFILDAVRVASPRLNFMALGLFCWVLVPLIQTIRGM